MNDDMWEWIAGQIGDAEKFKEFIKEIKSKI